MWAQCCNNYAKDWDLEPALIDELGGISDALAWLYREIER